MRIKDGRTLILEIKGYETDEEKAKHAVAKRCVGEGSRLLYSCQCEIGDVREIPTFSEWNGMEGPRHFIRDFCLWKMICDIGVINSGIKSGR